MKFNIDLKKIPKEVLHVTHTLEKNGFESYLVGGCVRDLVLGLEPKDWDITTNAVPEEIVKLFDKTVYENTFGTVAVCVPYETTKDAVSQGTEYMIIEVTPYRTEAEYSDFRHPDDVRFSQNLSDDLKRRDFTINALAMDSKGQVMDMFDGLKDIEKKILRTVGEAEERFQEDALRMLRAVRFSVQLNFSISHETTESILKNVDLIKKISAERIRDEFVKIIMSDSPAVGITMLQKFGILKNIIPELEEGIGCEQLGEHIYDIWNHLLHAMEHSAIKKWPLEIRLASLFHDIGKPRTRRFDQSKAGGKGKYTFYGHEVVGARMTKNILERLKFSKKEIELVEKLIRNHMFFSDTETITLSAVRRIITKVSKENIWGLMQVRECDRVGMKKKEAPYRLRKYFAMIEEALHDPISVSQLKIDGNFMMKNLGISAGPRMGWILNALLEEVLEDPSKNTIEILSEIVLKLNNLSDKELQKLGKKGKDKKEELEELEVKQLHQKHGV
ncbi:MAG: HD domain-containing protein [Candidatus Pacebacteria bacterium]|nr:HD domain-containing protein [Candidatus Paceibacterota bacterium]MCF7862687.1 HD domain-containing protein [Candidatus Paceibacterota bacterium]